MSTLRNHETEPWTRESTGWRSVPTEMWGTICIAAIWLGVLFTGVYGGDFVSSSGPTTYTNIPSVVLVAFFAFLATGSVAKRTFDRQRDRD
jgi:ABC-type nickel/cobalt efflux system permease component RcnA